MSKLLLHNRRIDSVFQLLGEKENDLTFAVGWALANSRSFLGSFLKEIGCAHSTIGDSTIVRLQTHESKRGITDIEIESGNDFFIIVEAKRGWHLPSRNQLSKYLGRHSFSSAKARFKAVVVLSECSKQYFNEFVEKPRHQGARLLDLPWKEVFHCSRRATGKSSHAEKRLLNELSIYLENIMTMQNKESNLVFVVSLSYRNPRGSTISYIDIVNDKRLYFHPMGTNGWPSEPPNYIGFRYDGKLQTIHYVKSYDVFTDPHVHIGEIEADNWGSYFLYHLGPPIRPNHEVRTGRIYRNGRVWCMLDALLTSRSISKARDITKKRMRQVQFEE